MVYYLGANLEWFGRQLNSYTIPDDTETTDVNESLNVSYTYDADGLRTSKTVVEKTPTDEYTYNYTYQYVGDKLYYLCANDENGNLDYEMYFFYDSYDKLTVLKYFKHTGENPGQYTYYVATNYFGDVVALYSGQGELLVSYEYDAWGNIIAVRDADEAIITDSDSIAHRNPIRYRSYYYDTETGLYYLQSRYYNPEIGRFLNSDNFMSKPGNNILGNNTYSYCNNNPVKFKDTSGHWSKGAETISFAAACVALVAATVATIAAIVATAPVSTVVLCVSLLAISTSSMISGIASHKSGNSFSNAYTGSVVSNSIKEIVGNKVKDNPLITAPVNAGGTYLGSTIALQLNNADPFSRNLTSTQIRENSIRAAVVAGITTFGTDTINNGVDMADTNGCLIYGYTSTFGVGLKTFFDVLDETINIICG